MDFLFKFHGDKARVALGVLHSGEGVRDRFRHGLVVREVLDGHVRLALLGVFKLNAHRVGQLLFHLGVEVQLVVHRNSIFVRLEHPEALVISVVDLAALEGLLLFHAGLHASFHRRSVHNALDGGKFSCDHFGFFRTLLIACFLLSTGSELLLLLFSPLFLHVEGRGKHTSGDGQVNVEFSSVNRLLSVPLREFLLQNLNTSAGFNLFPGRALHGKLYILGVSASTADVDNVVGVVGPLLDCQFFVEEVIFDRLLDYGV